ncbi:MAG: lysophospholipid acyltransferase family protein [Dehalococcoidia bacterium]
MSCFYRIGQVFVAAGFRLFTRWRVEGRENIPKEGGLLVVSNHLNFNDPPLLGASLNRRIVFMAKEELFRAPLIGWCLRRLGAFPVRRGRLDRQTIRRVEQVLDEGYALLMFPESTRSPKAQLQPALPGSALFASRHGVPVLPVAISGTEKFRQWFWMFRRPRITVKIGKPFTLPASDAKKSREKLAAHTEFIMRRIAELLPPEYRGVYGEGEK